MVDLETWVYRLQNPEVKKEALALIQNLGGDAKVNFNFRHPMLQEEPAQLALARLAYPVFAYPDTRSFLENSLGADSPSAVLDRRHYPNSFFRDLDSLGRYLSSTTSLAEEGNRLGVSRQRVFQIHHRALLKLRRHSPAPIKENFPLNQLIAGKPPYWPVLEALVRRLRPEAPTLARMLREGLEPATILQNLSLTRAELTSDERRYLKEHRLLTFTDPPRLLKSLSQILTEGDGQEIAQAMRQAEQHGRFQALCQGERPALYSLYDVSGLAGLYLRADRANQLANILEEAGIAVGRVHYPNGQRYYFVAASQLKQATEVLYHHPELRRYRQNPVRQIAAGTVPSAEIPATTQLSQKRGFEPLGRLAISLGIAYSRKGGGALEGLLGSDCPVPVFRWDKKRYRKYFFPSDGKEKLAAYLREKVRGRKPSC